MKIVKQKLTEKKESKKIELLNKLIEIINTIIDSKSNWQKAVGIKPSGFL